MSEIYIPHRADSLSPEEASKTISEALEIIHIAIGGGFNLPDWLIVRAHKLFAVQAVPADREKMRNHGCACKYCTPAHNKTFQQKHVLVVKNL